MQYWINQNGVQAGPVTREELEKMNVSADAYVWCSGLEDWVKITTLPELADVIGAPTAPAVPEVPAADEQLPEQPAEPAADAAPAEQPQDEEAPVIPEIPQEEEPEVVVGTPIEPVVGTPVEQYQYAPQYAAPQTQPEQPECPPTNLVWAIIVTLLCCMPMGIVAILYAVKVNRRYQAGDFKGAERASETGAWWCIASIISSIVFSPFISFIQMLVASM